MYRKLLLSLNFASIKLFFFRYLSYIFIGLEIVLLPMLVSNMDYGKIEYLKSLILLFPYALLGSFSGYIYCLYNLEKDYYPQLFTGALVTGLLIGLVVFLINPFLFLASIVNMFSVIIEKKLQTSNLFLLSILFKPLLSVVFLLVFYLKISFNHGLLISFCYLIALLIWLYLIKIFSYVIVIPRIVKLDKYFFYQYLTLIKKGFVINISTIIVSLFIFQNRFFINKFALDNLPSFSLAQNFSQIIFIGINTIGYISLVKFGENLKLISKKDVLKVFFKTIYAFIALELVAYLAINMYINIVGGFQKSLQYFIITSLCVGIYYSVSVIAPILLYKDKLNISTLVLGIFFILDYVSSWLLFDLIKINAFLIFIKSNLLLVICGLFNLHLIFNRISYNNYE